MDTTENRVPVQIGIFSVSDLTPDPTTGITPTEHERLKNYALIVKKAEEIGLDAFALGEHHNPLRLVVADHHAGLVGCADQQDHAVHRHHADHHR